MEPYYGEIRVFAFDFVPEGWLACDGAILQINQFTALYSLLGTKFGGDGKKTFAVPDLRGRTVVGANLYDIPNSTYNRGTSFGSENVSVNISQMPAHNHLFNVKSGKGNALEPSNVLAAPAGIEAYNNVGGGQLKPLNASSVGVFGTGLPHPNMQPGLTVNFCIAVSGNYPPMD